MLPNQVLHTCRNCSHAEIAPMQMYSMPPQILEFGQLIKSNSSSSVVELSEIIKLKTSKSYYFLREKLPHVVPHLLDRPLTRNRRVLEAQLVKKAFLVIIDGEKAGAQYKWYRKLIGNFRLVTSAPELYKFYIP